MNSQRTTSEIASRKATRAVVCLVFGIVAALLGSLLTLIAWMQGADAHPWLRGFGTAFLVLIIPLLILAGFYLDDMEQAATGRPAEKQRSRERGSVFGSLLSRLTLCFCLLLLVPGELRAQQTVFNVPTTDVLDKGKVYFELDISAKPNNSEALNKFSSFVPRFVVGTGGRVEVGLNITGNIQPGPDSTTLVPAVKWKVYDGGDNGWAIAVGNHLFIPVRNKSYEVGNHSYVMVQKTFKTKTRVGFGSGVFTRDVVAPNAVLGVGQFTLEQPITDKFGVGADWYTGKHASGYVTSGGHYKFTKKLTSYVAYSIGNANALKGNHNLYFEVGYILN